MSDSARLPKTLLEAVTYFSDKNVCIAFLAGRRWADGVTCKCGSKNVTAIRTRQIWQCKDCRKQFSVKIGTIFEDSALPLSKWLPCLWLITNAKNGISSCEVARALGVTQKTAWFMLHRIREAMRAGTIEKMNGVVEADESYLGGSRTNWRNAKRAAIDPNFDHKTPIVAVVEREGNVVANVIDSATEENVKQEVRKYVESGAVLYTDQSYVYQDLGREYWHATVNHSSKEYARGNVSTNTVEGFFGLLKRTIKGTYIHMAPFHIDRYLDEQCLRYNLRNGNDLSRFEQVVSQSFGRRLTWNELTGACQQ